MKKRLVAIAVVSFVAYCGLQAASGFHLAARIVPEMHAHMSALNAAIE